MPKYSPHTENSGTCTQKIISDIFISHAPQLSTTQRSAAVLHEYHEFPAVPMAASNKKYHLPNSSLQHTMRDGSMPRVERNDSKEPLICRLSAVYRTAASSSRGPPVSKRQVLVFAPCLGEDSATAWVGRDAERNDLIIAESGVARVHALFTILGDGIATISDLATSH